MSLPCCKARAANYVTEYKVLQFGVHDYSHHADCDSNSAGKRFRWSSGSVLPLSTQVRGFKPGRNRQDFSGRKKPLGTPSFGREVKPWVPCRKSLNWRGSRNLRQNFWLILAHIFPPFATRISRVVRGHGGHLSANMGASKHARGIGWVQ